ncbi:MAG: GNAT family protein, partial [Planctomycetota bacterium]|nr:GNAT family protein [Planctomycetota bacterium]
MSAPRTNPKPPGLNRALAIGPRVFLRRPVPGDYDEFLQRMRDSRPLHAAYTAPMRNREDYEAMLQRSRQRNRVMMLICRLEDGAIVGQINLNDIIRGITQQAYIGYHVFVPFQGRGYMIEGVDLALRYAFRGLKLHRIEAGIQPDNERSLALVKRLGFRYEGTARRLLKLAGRWRDHER